MLAIQNMKVPEDDAPLGDITNFSTPTQPPSSNPQSFESIHTQMLNLTAIANALQKEMTALSRRSKDNATDLISLKEATKGRDEDIRKSLRELVSSARASDAGLLCPPDHSVTRPNSALGITPSFLDHKIHHSPPFGKSISLPKIPPVHSFEVNSEHDRAASPSLYSVEGAASVAMLEKIIREMVTKEGQERLISQLSELLDKSNKESSDTSKKVAELVEFIQDKSTSKALVRHNNRKSSVLSDAASIDDSRDVVPRGDRRKISERHTPQPQASMVTDEFQKLLQKTKDSVMQGGAMTGEVKTLLRELRGEVLGMGRELGRKLERLENSTNGRSNSPEGVSRLDLEEVVQEGLADLKDQMDHVIQTRRRQSGASIISKSTLDNQEVYDVVKHALSEQAFDRSQALQAPDAVDRESILSAVREACESYKPEIELQQFGLERDEILQCLREGLEDYQSSRSGPETHGTSREEVMATVQEAMQNFTPPAPANEALEIKEEVVDAVRECLENFKPPAGERPTSRGSDISRHDVLDAIREGLFEFKKDGAREIEISPEDLSHAVQYGLENMSNPFGAYGEQVLNSLHEIVEGMRVEFKQYSAANGRDTEQVLDAMKDGLEDLRAEIETYVDRAQDVTGKDEIIDILKTELDGLRSNFDSAVARHDRTDDISAKSNDLTEYIKAEFEHLHDALASQSGSSNHANVHREEILLAISEGFTRLKPDSGERGVDDSVEDQLNAMKEEFEQLKDTLLEANAGSKEEVLDSMQESFSNLHERVAGLGYSGAGNREVIEVMKEEFAALRDSQKAPVLHSGRNEEPQDDILDAVKASVDSIRVQLSADQSESANEHLGLIKEELENFREAIGGSLLLNTPGADKDAIVEAIKDHLASHRATSDREMPWTDPESLEAIRSEIEHLRQSISTSLVQSGPHASTEEILETVRNGLDDLKAQMSSQVTFPESANKIGNEALDGLTGNLNNMRTDIAKMLDKPVDMTVSYEILDTLKDGLASVRVDIERIKSDDREVVLAKSGNGNEESNTRNADSAPSSLRKEDLQGIEVLLAQLQIKVEAMDQNMQSIPFTGTSATTSQSAGQSASKEDLAIFEHMLRDLQSSVDGLASREPTETRGVPAGGASKEDTDAIETLLQNTKAKIDEEILPGLQSVGTRDHINTLEAVVRMTNETVDDLAGKIEGHPSAKEDIEALALMVHDASTSLNDIKERLESGPENGKVSKDDIDLIGGLCSEIKDKVKDMPSHEHLASREDVEALADLLHDFHESHNQLKESYESDIGVTAKAFDDRKSEAKDILEHLEELKEAIAESRDSLKSRIKRGNEDVRALDEILEGIEEKIDDAPTAIEGVQELKETVNREFERANTALEAIKGEQEAKAASILEKADAHEATIISELVQKFDERFDSIMQRHDEHQNLADQMANTLTEKSAHQDDLLSGTRSMAEELKLTIDTLGASVSAIVPVLEESTNKMGDDAKTVFTKVDDMCNKVDDTNADNKVEHQLTRDDIAKNFSAMDSLREEIATHNPRFMDAINNLLSLVEHQTRKSEESTEKSSDGIKAYFDEGLKRLPVPQIEAPSTSTPVEKFDDSKLHDKLDEVLSRGQTVSYDDSKLQSKLDEMIRNAVKPSQLERLEEIQQQVTTTASEVSAFCAFQTKMLSAEHENKEKEADQAALDLSKCLNEKESIEADLVELKESKESLASDLEGLKSEREELVNQKMRLSADLSSFETALTIRREELHMMDTRADALERRIIEGVMDHSRLLLMAKAPRSTVNMNLKRVPSNQSATTAATTTPSMVNAGVDMALKSRSDGRRSQQSLNPSSRRIASLSQITHNVPTGGKGLSATPRNAGGLGNLKRSQSVKTANARKHSWNAPVQGSLGGFDKENSVLSEESDEENEGDFEHSRTASTGAKTVSIPPTPGSDRRTSLSYTTGPSEYTYGTGSYFTGSDTTDRRTSFGSTVRSNVGAGTSLDDSIDGDEEQSTETRTAEDEEEPEEPEEPHQGDTEPAQIEASPSETSHSARAEDENKGVVLHHPDGYDSGLGSDLPTAALSAPHVNGSDYFKHALEEA